MLHFQQAIVAAGALGAVFALTACSGDVSQVNPAGGGGGGSSTSSSASSSASSGMGGADGGAPKVCGGKIGTPCGADEWCAYSPAGSCGAADNTGICQPRPQACTDDCPGVCGCDGKFYCNACGAEGAGVDVSSSTDCLISPGAVITAASLFTAVPRFMIFKAIPAKDVCFRMWVEASGSPGIGIKAPVGWAVTMAEVTAHASDCMLVNGAPPITMTSVQALSGTGYLDILNAGATCSVNIHATLSFKVGLPWVPASEAIDGDKVDVAGGCN
jgi:hypothetical protein